MDPFSVAIAVALTQGLVQVGGKLLEVSFDASLEPVKELIKERTLRGYRQAEKNKKLLEMVRQSLKEGGAPVDDEDQLRAWLKHTGLARLQAEGNHGLRRQVARAILGFTDPDAAPPEDLIVALGWPHSQASQLSQLLAGLRAGLAALDEWKDLLSYADSAAERGLLRQIIAQLEKLDNLLVHSEAGDALRVVVIQQGLTLAEVDQIEEHYRADLVRDLAMHDFRGIVQMKRDIRLPLADIYLELGLLSMGDAEAHRQAQERLLELRDAERTQEEERRAEQRVTDALTRAQRLVILGEPGAGKTISLHYIALLLAYGFGAARLGLEKPFIPLLARLADYARALEEKPALSLDNYLLDYIEQAYASDPHLSEFLRLALGQGVCIVLLDGLDEVGGDLRKGLPLRTRVVQRVQQFADRWCSKDRSNRLVVTSRIEGYWDEALHGFEHVQLSPLRPPDEVEEFLLRWYTAHEQSHEKGLSLEVASRRAQGKVEKLLPSVLETAGVRRLATNPLLLTILALIQENVGRLPNRRIKLYEICAQTLIESWRQAQTGMTDELFSDLGEEAIIRIIAPLAFWLHENKPGGTASYDEWYTRLNEILREEGYAREAYDLAERFLHHARYQTGLLAERGLGQYGFFHLTFEEYLAARQIARQRAEERRTLLQSHWKDPRWQEVILLAAGQLGIAESRTDDVSDFIEDLLKMESPNPESVGRPALLAGRALTDIGQRSVNNNTRRWVLQALRVSSQDLDPEREEPNQPMRVPIRTRAAAADTLDELGWLPPDLYQFVRIAPGDPQAAAIRTVLPRPDYPFCIGLHPVTNAQYARFLEAGDYAEERLWSDLPKFAEDSQPMPGQTWGDEGWKWLKGMQEDRERSPDGLHVLPRFWNDPRFGIGRKGAPVVGVTWYEANAYCRWLCKHWDDPDMLEAEAIPGLPPRLVRLPTEAEWALAAGGDQPEGRYPWDAAPGQATQDLEEILQRANVDESGIGRTTPAGMYPLGRSQPYRLWDLAGNAWEWQANHYKEGENWLALRGGAWNLYHSVARAACRNYNRPSSEWLNYGFRVVALPS